MSIRRAANRAVFVRARWYAIAKHWPVLPVHSIVAGRCTCGRVDCASPGKHPRTMNGLKDATTDLGVIMSWIDRWPTVNIAVLTGSRSFIALDVDPRHGGDDSLFELERSHGPIPTTVEALTGGGGRHILFQHPGRPVLNRTNLEPGLDVRGDAGYIIVPPSVHESGRCYEWEVDHQPDAVELAPAPQWLLDTIIGAKQPTMPVDSSVWRTLLVEGVREGARNDALTRLVGHFLRRYVDPHLVLEMARCVNESRFKPPLPDIELLKIVDSICARELSRREAASYG